ncbi:MAG TPA: glycoside hydrolase family 2 TIM barrel-domain containing protein, partial [Acidimicrobiales bacterium]|nr:glycoside hydrolase family 2 TIM barrel-domain containing protein [Acidimicrobiales bacterium]
MSASRIDPSATGHPRPDRRRERWASLEGTWEFSFDEPSFDQAIVVPFAYQCERSTIDTIDPHEVLWYRRRFTPPAHATDERVLLHFGAVDFAATVWVDGTEVGRHRGGHTSFTCDVTDALLPDADADVHEVRVQVVDEFRADQLRGKQTATFPFFVHYTATSGIWQSVWCEVTGPRWVRESHVVAEADGTIAVGVDIAGAPGGTVRVTVGDDDSGGALVLEGAAGTEVSGRHGAVRRWSPTDPALFALRIDVLDDDGRIQDTVFGHVGFRTVTVEAGRWLLNGEPLYQRLLLDQGYWPESLLTPPSDDALVADLTYVRDAGFNGVRKHQKIEDPRFLWHADRLGLVVWEELPSPFWLAHIEGDLEGDATAEWTEAIVRDRNHPSVVAWVPFNESWGVQDLHRVPERRDTVRRLVAHTRALDPTRPVVDNSGWGHVDTDIVDVHDYDQDPARLTARWTGIEAKGWDRGPAIDGEGSTDPDEIDAALQRWRAFVDPPEADLVDDRWMIEALPDTAVWAPGCLPEPGTAG